MKIRLVKMRSGHTAKPLAEDRLRQGKTGVNDAEQRFERGENSKYTVCRAVIASRYLHC